jgi:hypothetical protein
MDWRHRSKGECRDGMNLVHLPPANYADTSSSSTFPKPYPIMPENPNIRLSKKIMQR